MAPDIPDSCQEPTCHQWLQSGELCQIKSNLKSSKAYHYQHDLSQSQTCMVFDIPDSCQEPPYHQRLHTGELGDIKFNFEIFKHYHYKNNLLIHPTWMVPHTHSWLPWWKRNWFSQNPSFSNKRKGGFCEKQSMRNWYLQNPSLCPLTDVL